METLHCPSCPAGHVAELAILAARMVIESGGETYRAEETATYICKGANYSDVRVVCTPTALYLTICSGGAYTTVTDRVRKRSTDLSMLGEVNQISRLVAFGQLTIEQAEKELSRLEKDPGQNPRLSALAAGIAGGGFALMFAGGWQEVLVAALCSLLTQGCIGFFGKKGLGKFNNSLIGGALTALLALSASLVIKTLTVSTVIIGATLPLLPGVAITNAIRDTINGDLTSGVARCMEALMTAAAIAGGAGAVMALLRPLTGGVGFGI
jgi:uncharacterized membrane protein YjjP (DUF1212 family)